MTDYIACGQVVPERIAAIVKGIAEACVAGRLRPGRRRDGRAPRPARRRTSTTSRAPATGVVEARPAARPGPGPDRRRRWWRWRPRGLHSNGYSLVRRVFERGRLGAGPRRRRARPHARRGAARADPDLRAGLPDLARRRAPTCTPSATSPAAGSPPTWPGCCRRRPARDRRPLDLDARRRSSTWSARSARSPPEDLERRSTCGVGMIAVGARRRGRRGRRDRWPSAACRAWVAGEIDRPRPSTAHGRGVSGDDAAPTAAGRSAARRRDASRAIVLGTHTGTASSGPATARRTCDGACVAGEQPTGRRSVTRRRRIRRTGVRVVVRVVRARLRRAESTRAAHRERERSVPAAAVLQLAGDLRLLGLGPAAPHGSTPSRVCRGGTLKSRRPEQRSTSTDLPANGRCPRGQRYRGAQSSRSLATRSSGARRAGATERRRRRDAAGRLSGREPDAAQPADSRHPPLGEPVGRDRRRDAARPSQREDRAAWCRRSRGRLALARSKLKPSSSSATWITPPALTT